MTVAETLGDIAESLAKLNPAQVLELRASEAMSERVEELVFKKKDGLINASCDQPQRGEIFVGK